MLAPIIKLTDPVKVIIPALTKLTAKTEVAEDNCNIAVNTIPVNKALNLLEVIAESMCLIESPATFCKDSLINFMPYKNNPIEPKRVSILSMIVNCENYSRNKRQIYYQNHSPKLS